MAVIEYDYDYITMCAHLCRQFRHIRQLGTARISPRRAIEKQPARCRLFFYVVLRRGEPPGGVTR